MPSERELKFSRSDERVPSSAELAPHLEAVGLALGPATHVVQKDRYYDDARASLGRAGLALRQRMSEGAVVATLKSAGAVEGALHEREELELPVPADASAGEPWPHEIAERVRMVTDPRTLKAIFELNTERVVFDVLDGEAAAAQLSFDAVRARRPGGSNSAHFDELEVEAIGEAPAELLERVAAALQEVLVLTPASHTKLERARALLMLID